LPGPFHIQDIDPAWRGGRSRSENTFQRARFLIAARKTRVEKTEQQLSIQATLLHSEQQTPWRTISSIRHSRPARR
jgi:hypothetical protein